MNLNFSSALEMHVISSIHCLKSVETSMLDRQLGQEDWKTEQIVILL